ncbi:hypothetical protein GCM10011611_64290 [Aliidongia dinghuensis]|uniref:Sulfatase n=1 Tax=Aliidongia dinghuensis TaxID=1867774 RepID=A0A8J2Z056_9PROT|nr:hypothetical protein [Aliidongia dinghuensis]GGF49048.1 hypothetical protein GCM10011611_64290 [Aliidongia dinghuensis]
MQSTNRIRRRRESVKYPSLAMLVGLILLFGLFALTASRVGRLPSLDPRVPAEFLALLAVVSLAPLVGRRWPWPLRWFLAAVLLPLALVHLADVEGPALMGRDLDLAADLGHVPSLVSLFAGAASPWQLLGAAVAALIVPIGLVAAIALSLGAVERGLGQWPQALRLLPLGLATLAFIVARTPEGARFVALGTVTSLDRQAGTVVDAWRLAHGDQSAFLARLGPPPATPTALGGLGRRDVWLIFFESYGAVLLDDPELRTRALPALTQFQERLTAAGVSLRSARIASPTYGGGSWFAHGTVDAGTWLPNQRLYTLETTTDRPTWPGVMAKAGWQTFDIQPGLKTPLANAAFWGFERIVGTDDFQYTGPNFGWFAIPDQYALDRALALPRDPARPLFAQIVLVSSHIPFHPVPPVVAEPADAERLTQDPETARRIATPPDWNNLAGPYLQSVEYDLTVLAQWLPQALDAGAVAIILGDHQPPALIGHASASHDVPIHILSRDAAFLRRLADRGFVDGAVPTGSAGTMAELMGRFLAVAAGPAETASPAAASSTE